MKAGSELKLFVENTLRDIGSSLPEGYELKNQEEAEVYFELTGTTTKTIDGKIDFHFAATGGEHSNEDSALVSFGVGKKLTSAEEAEKIIALLKSMAVGAANMQKPEEKKTAKESLK